MTNKDGSSTKEPVALSTNLLDNLLHNNNVYGFLIYATKPFYTQNHEDTRFEFERTNEIKGFQKRSVAKPHVPTLEYFRSSSNQKANQVSSWILGIHGRYLLDLFHNRVF